MKIAYLILLVFLSASTFAQKQREFRSLAEAEKNPEEVLILNLSRQKLREFPIQVLNFPNLKILDLSKNKISQLPIEIEQLQELKELDLSRNEIAILPKEIGSLIHLEKLILYKNKVKAFPSSMEKLKNLNILNIRGTIIPEKEIASLQNALPKTNILFTKGCYCGNGILTE